MIYMKTRLSDWVNSLSWDWVISRQRYFATPIPIWECADCDHVIVSSEDACYIDPTITPAPVEKCPICGCTEFIGCQDVFDTWMDSSISPLFNSYWQRDNEKFNTLFPIILLSITNFLDVPIRPFFISNCRLFFRRTKNQAFSSSILVNLLLPFCS